jgi:hypothetical protein
MSMRSSDQGATLIPVPEAVKGVAPARAAELIEQFSFEEMIRAGDVSLIVFLNYGEAFRLAKVARSGPCVPLEHSLNAAVGETRLARRTAT